MKTRFRIASTISDRLLSDLLRKISGVMPMDGSDINIKIRWSAHNDMWIAMIYKRVKVS